MTNLYNDLLNILYYDSYDYYSYEEDKDFNINTYDEFKKYIFEGDDIGIDKINDENWYVSNIEDMAEEKLFYINFDKIENNTKDRCPTIIKLNWNDNIIVMLFFNKYQNDYCKIKYRMCATGMESMFESYPNAKLNIPYHILIDTNTSKYIIKQKPIDTLDQSDTYDRLEMFQYKESENVKKNSCYVPQYFDPKHIHEDSEHVKDKISFYVSKYFNPEHYEVIKTYKTYDDINHVIDISGFLNIYFNKDMKSSYLYKDTIDPLNFYNFYDIFKLI